MAIPEGHKTNLSTILQAARDGNLGLIECQDAETGEPVVVLAAFSRQDDGEVVVTPMARLFDGNPYEQLLIPPA